MTSVVLLARICSLGMLFGEWGWLVSCPRCRKDRSVIQGWKIKTLNKKGEVRYTCLEFTAISAQSLGIYRRKKRSATMTTTLTTNTHVRQTDNKNSKCNDKRMSIFKFIHSKQRISLCFFKVMASQYDLIMDLRLLLLWLRCKIDRSIAIFSCQPTWA